MWLKAIWCISVATSFVIAAEKSGWKESKYIAALFFGYTSFRLWGAQKPNTQLATFWFYVQPFLFGTVGASLNFKKIDSSLLGYSVVCIICGLFVRALTTFLVTYSKKYTIKERIFMACTWIPKATV